MLRRAPGRAPNYRALADDAVLLERQVVHRLVHRLLNLLPVTPPLDEFVDVLKSKINQDSSIRLTSLPYLWSECPTVPLHIPHDLSEVLRIRHDINVAQNLEIGEITRDRRNLQRCDEPVICVEIRNDLESAFERNNLSLDVFLDDPGPRVSGRCARNKGTALVRMQSNADFLVKNLEYFLARTASE